MRRLTIPLLVTLAAVTAASVARASAPPVGPLPAGYKATIATRAGELVAVALPHRSGGRVWRIARPFDGKVVHEVSEADVGTNVVIVFTADSRGSTKLVYALTKGETTKALDARTFVIAVH
jgi:hypothetical protein